MQYIACMLINVQTKRWHPILFREALFPGCESLGRYKSSGHHTNGFDTIEEAISSLRDCDIFKVKLVCNIYSWDGKETPAMVELIPNDDTTTNEEVEVCLIRAAGEILENIKNGKETSTI
jgi:hypothetical protein